MIAYIGQVSADEKSGGFWRFPGESQALGQHDPSSPRSDVQLLADINAGDDGAFDVLYYRHRDWVLRLAQRFTGNPDDALDVMQETFTYLIGKLPGLVLSARLTTFLYPVVKNLSISIRRKRTREIPGSELADFPAASNVDPQDQRSDLAVAMGSLPDIQREVVLMRFVDDMTVAEIAAALIIPEGTVKSRLHHAIAAMRTDGSMRAYFER
jgi:RNA polymerase sigma-70 factor, ECF subfamily